MDTRKYRIIDAQSGEASVAHAEVEFIVDDPHLVFTVQGSQVLVHPDDLIQDKILLAIVSGERRELKVQVSKS